MRGDSPPRRPHRAPQHMLRHNQPPDGSGGVSGLQASGRSDKVPRTMRSSRGHRMERGVNHQIRNEMKPLLYVVLAFAVITAVGLVLWIIHDLWGAMLIAGLVAYLSTKAIHHLKDR